MECYNSLEHFQRTQETQLCSTVQAHVVVNYLFQLIISFYFIFFQICVWVWRIMYANEFKTKEKQKLTEVKN